MQYNSVKNEKIKDLKKLSQKKYREKTKTFIVEGFHLVKEAEKSGYLKEVLSETPYISKVENHIINRQITNYLTEVESPQGIFGICQIKENKIKGDHILILDGVQDPGNMGTIIRTSAAFDIDTIIVNDKCTDPYSSKVVRSTQGMIFYQNIVKKDISEIIENLKPEYKIYGTKVNGGKELKSIEKNPKFAIIMGNEGNGVESKILDKCDEYIYINMNKNCESLNVAVATSIILYEFKRWKKWFI